MIDLLTQLSIPYRQAGEHQNVRQGFVGVECPRCGRGSEKFHCGINLESRYATCWQCGPIRLGDLLMEITGEPWPVVMGWLDSIGSTPKRLRPLPNYKGKYKFPGHRETLSRIYRRYLISRGFDPNKIIDRWKVQATGPVGRYAWRLFLPICIDGVPVSWTTRSIGKGQPRYISADHTQESVPHKNLLYGEDYARHAIVITEGPIDAWAIGPGGVATMGLTWTSSQVLRMSRYPVRAVCFDRTPDAQARAAKLCKILSVFPGENMVISLESGEDAAACNPLEIKELREMVFGKE